MATLSVLKFNTPEGAQQLLDRLQSPPKRQPVPIQDGTMVTWVAGAKKPRTKQLQNLGGTSVLDGAFWNLLFGLLFFIPAWDPAGRALAGHFAEYGIDDNFINETRSRVIDGTSALFILTSGTILYRLAKALKGIRFELVSTNLSKQEQEKLEAAFAV